MVYDLRWLQVEGSDHTCVGTADGPCPLVLAGTMNRVCVKDSEEVRLELGHFVASLLQRRLGL